MPAGFIDFSTGSPYLLYSCSKSLFFLELPALEHRIQLSSFVLEPQTSWILILCICLAVPNQILEYTLNPTSHTLRVALSVFSVRVLVTLVFHVTRADASVKYIIAWMQDSILASLP